MRVRGSGAQHLHEGPASDLAHDTQQKLLWILDGRTLGIPLMGSTMYAIGWRTHGL